MHIDSMPNPAVHSDCAIKLRSVLELQR